MRKQSVVWAKVKLFTDTAWNSSPLFRIFVFIAVVTSIAMSILWICHISINFAVNSREATDDAYELIASYPVLYDDPILLDKIKVAIEDNFLSSGEWNEIYARVTALKDEEADREKKRFIEETREKLK